MVTKEYDTGQKCNFSALDEARSRQLEDRGWLLHLQIDTRQRWCTAY